MAIKDLSVDNRWYQVALNSLYEWEPTDVYIPDKRCSSCNTPLNSHSAKLGNLCCHCTENKYVKRVVIHTKHTYKEVSISEKSYTEKRYFHYHSVTHRDKDKRKAWSTVSRAVKKGILVRPDVCSSCNKECKPDAHHEDYSKPLEVIWLCRACHKNISVVL